MREICFHNWQQADECEDEVICNICGDHGRVIHETNTIYEASEMEDLIARKGTGSIWDIPVTPPTDPHARAEAALRELKDALDDLMEGR